MSSKRVLKKRDFCFQKSAVRFQAGKLAMKPAVAGSASNIGGTFPSFFAFFSPWFILFASNPMISCGWQPE
jgi:hypothetical protein